MKILLVYETSEGHTARVAEVLRDRMAAMGHTVALRRVREATAEDLATAGMVVLGSPIHMGRHAGRLLAYAKAHRDALAVRPTACFTVCLSARGLRPQDVQEVARYEQAFVEAAGWTPDRVSTFAGALPYRRMGFLKRAILARIQAEAGGETDTSVDHEFTDWDAVADFARDLDELARGLRLRGSEAGLSPVSPSGGGPGAR